MRSTRIGVILLFLVLGGLILMVPVGLNSGLPEWIGSLTKEEEVLSGSCTLLCMVLTPIALIGGNFLRSNQIDTELQLDENPNEE